MLAVGVEAPKFALKDSAGQVRRLSDHAGSWVVFWWYPEANSSGCSVQAASLERSLDDFAQEGIEVLGASFNTVEQNDEFACDKSLRLTLLSDADKAVGQAYEVIRDPDDPYPTKPKRITYVVNPAGRIAYAEDANGVDLNKYGPHLLGVVKGLRSET